MKKFDEEVMIYHVYIWTADRPTLFCFRRTIDRLWIYRTRTTTDM